MRVSPSSLIRGRIAGKPCAYRDCPDEVIPIIRDFILSGWREPAN
jgi:hypothetical protein